MYIKTLIFAAITLVFTSFPAFAATPQVHQLRTMTSAPGQSKVAFLVDVAHWMRAWSDKTGFEACGWLSRDRDGRYGIVITTFGAHVGCRLDDAAIPTGMHSIKVTIHSHLRAGGSYTNTRDNVLDRTPLDRKVWTHFYKNGEDNFSPKDYRSGYPGYLVGVHGLYFQYGKGTQSLVATLKNG